MSLHSKSWKNSYLTLPDHLTHALPEQNGSITGIVARAQAIKDQLLDYETTKESAETLKEATEQIQALHQEQMHWFRTLSTEMETAFSAIHRYAGFVDGSLQEDYSHMDEVFLENLKDSGQNLKFLANGFYLMCLHKSGQYQPEQQTVDATAMLHQVADLFRASAEFRDISLQIKSSGTQTLQGDPTIIRHLFWGMTYLMMQYADDSAKVSLQLCRSPSGLTVEANASCALDGLVKNVDSDIAAFFPESLSKEGQLIAAIQSHVDIQIIDYLPQNLCGAAIASIEANEINNNRLSFSIRITLPVSPTTT